MENKVFYLENEVVSGLFVRGCMYMHRGRCKLDVLCAWGGMRIVPNFKRWAMVLWKRDTFTHDESWHHYLFVLQIYISLYKYLRSVRRRTDYLIRPWYITVRGRSRAFMLVVRGARISPSDLHYHRHSGTWSCVLSPRMYAITMNLFSVCCYL